VSGAARALAASALFADIPPDVLDDVGRLMSPVSFDAGEIVFRQGEPGHSLLVLEDGALEAEVAVPGGPSLRLSTIAAGEVVGELSLLGDGRRTATVRATKPSAGWSLERAAFDVLRHDARPAATAVARAIGRLAVQRLDRLHRRFTAEITGAAAVPHGGEVKPAEDALDVDYLRGTLFFAECAADEVATITAGAPRIELSRGTVLVESGRMPAALWIVARGAIETTLRGADTVKRLRLAGPGRAVGHVGLLGAGACIDRIECRARERSILIELAWPRTHALLAGEDRAARRFAAALWTDAVRALQHGERPLAQMTVRPPAAGAERERPRAARG
jgi:CRP-like cAMP-binding protein